MKNISFNMDQNILLNAIAIIGITILGVTFNNTYKDLYITTTAIKKL